MVACRPTTTPDAAGLRRNTSGSWGGSVRRDAATGVPSPAPPARYGVARSVSTSGACQRQCHHARRMVVIKSPLSDYSGTVELTLALWSSQWSSHCQLSSGSACTDVVDKRHGDITDRASGPESPGGGEAYVSRARHHACRHVSHVLLGHEGPLRTRPVLHTLGGRKWVLKARNWSS